MKNRQVVALMVVCVLAAAPLQGQVLPGRWEKLEQLQPGTRIIVRLQAGDRLEGGFQRITQDAIVLTEENSQERTIAKSMVSSIETSKKAPDRLRNGTLIGLLVGAAAGIASMAAIAEAKTSGPVYWGDEDGPGYLLGAALVGGGIGAATGAIVDASIKRHEVLYQAR
jgi:hypothetical protein